MRRLIEYRFVLSLAASAVVGVLGLHAWAFLADIGAAARAVVAAMKTPEWTALLESGGALAPEVPFATATVEGSGHVTVTVVRIDLLKNVGGTVDVID